MVHVGFIGCHKLTGQHIASTARVLQSLAPLTLHHCDTFDGDAWAHQIAEAGGWPIIIHPVSGMLRGLRSSTMRPPVASRANGHQMLMEVSHLVACIRHPEARYSLGWPVAADADDREDRHGDR